MNARIVLPLATLTLLVSAFVYAKATGGAPATVMPDNEAQARARAILYGEDTASAPKATNPQAKVSPTPRATGSTAPAAVMLAKSDADNEAQARARALLREGDGDPAILLVASPAPDNQAQARSRDLLRETEPSRETLLAASPAPNNTAQAKAIDLLWGGVDTTLVGAGSRTGPSSALTAGMVAPALPVNATAREKLDALLVQYRANYISPLQYHTSRALIVASL